MIHTRHRHPFAAGLFLATGLLLTACSHNQRVAAQGAPPYNRPANAIPMPEFPPGLPWFNVNKPLTMQGLRGKMVVLDFWTYG